MVAYEALHKSDKLKEINSGTWGKNIDFTGIPEAVRLAAYDLIICDSLDWTVFTVSGEGESENYEEWMIAKVYEDSENPNRFNLVISLVKRRLDYNQQKDLQTFYVLKNYESEEEYDDIPF